jgi:hypothetical protein
MLKKYISKFTIDIMPSIIATIVGAYIVNHYIVPKSADAPAAATASTGDSKAAAPAKVMKASIKSGETSADIANTSDAAAAPADKPVAEKTNSEKTNPEKNAETSSPVTRRHQPAPREKAVAEKPAPEKPATKPAATVAVAPVVAAPPATASIAPAAEPIPAQSAADANDLARAAIERLRGTGEASRSDAPRADAPRVQEAVRIPEAPRPAPAIQQLPPPITVSTPSVETSVPSYSDATRANDPRRPRPPGDIPLAPPLDLEANAAGSTRQGNTNVADDMLSAAKSVFHSVIPRQFER